MPSIELKVDQSPANFFQSWPSDWNFDRDLVVVVGTPSAEDCARLGRTGQVRIVELVSGCDSDRGSSQARSDSGLGANRNWPCVRNCAELFAELEQWAHPVPRRARLLLCENYSDSVHANPRELEQVLSNCLDLLGDCEQRLGRLGQRWVTQTIRNLPSAAAASTIESLRGAFEGVPCAIVSPGPSLDECAAHLPKLSERALVLTCSHALEALRRADVVPDMVMVADPMDLRRHFDNQPTDSFGALILAGVAHPALFETEAGAQFSFSSGTPMERWAFGALGLPVQLSSGGSVACTEFSLARYMGCNPIILVGQDMAFPQGRYYASSSLDGATELEITKDGSSFVLAFREPRAASHATQHTRRSEPEALLEVPAQGGGTVATSASLRRFLRWFQLQVDSQSPADQWVNCTVGGAAIEGMRHSDLRTELGALSSKRPDVRAILNECAERGRTPERVRGALSKLGEWAEALGRLEILVREFASRETGSELSPAERTELLQQFAQMPPLQWMDWDHASQLQAALKSGAALERVQPLLSRAQDLCAQLRRYAIDSMQS